MNSKLPGRQPIIFWHCYHGYNHPLFTQQYYCFVLQSLPDTFRCSFPSSFHIQDSSLDSEEHHSDKNHVVFLPPPQAQLHTIHRQGWRHHRWSSQRQIWKWLQLPEKSSPAHICQLSPEVAPWPIPKRQLVMCGQSPPCLLCSAGCISCIWYNG